MAHFINRSLYVIFPQINENEELTTICDDLISRVAPED